MKFLSFIVLCILFSQVTTGQSNLTRNEYNDSTVLLTDTIVSKSGDFKLTHYHMVSRMIERKILFDAKDSIFNDNFNSFSRLIFYSRRHSFDIPTIPLTNVIFLETAGLILGLSKITTSPYNLVLYSMEGKLLYKASLKILELKVSKAQLRALLKTYPGLHKCLSQMTIVKENEYYYLELSQCFLNTIGRDSIRKMEILEPNHYFPQMGQSILEDFGYAEYQNYFSSSDPLHDLIIIGSVPYLLILNSEKGTKVNIPLRSNCDIFKELNE